MNSETPAAQTAEPAIAEPGRIIGYDVARSVAMLGMIVVHFSLVAASERTGPEWMSFILSLLDGRASATFVILAGIGLTLLSRKAVDSGDPQAVIKVQNIFVRRGIFLLIVGFINLTIWPGDILRIYGVSLLIASRLLRAPNRVLLAVAIGFALTFALLLMVCDFEKNWEWQTMTYRNLWTPTGIVRNLFFDGFRSVFPWTGFLLFGMWLGRFDLTDRDLNSRLLIASGLTAIGAELTSRLLLWFLRTRPQEGLDTATVQALFGTESMPALPLFLMAAGGTGTAVIALSVRLTSALPSRIWTPLVATGQMALTWYFAHIVVGLGSLVLFNLAGTQSLPAAASYGLLFFATAVLISCAWKSSARYGPLEWVMRQTAG